MITSLFRVEILKIRRSLALLMLLACPLMVLLLVLGVTLRQHGPGEFQAAVWVSMWQAIAALWSYFMLPLYIALITSLLNGNEHKNQTWRLMLALPISQRQLYLAKALLAWAFVVGANLMLVVLAGAAILALGAIGYPLQGAFDYTVWGLLIKIPVACVPILLIQHAVSWRFENIVFPLAVGVIATMGIVQLGSSEYWVYYPWSYILMSVNGGSPELQRQALLLSIVVGPALYFASSYWLGRREVG